MTNIQPYQDMLKRHQCVLDLRANSLTIGTTGTTVQFLSEGQLDASARLAGPAAEAAQREEMVSSEINLIDQIIFE